MAYTEPVFHAKVRAPFIIGTFRFLFMLSSSSTWLVGGNFTVMTVGLMIHKLSTPSSPADCKWRNSHNYATAALVTTHGYTLRCLRGVLKVIWGRDDTIMSFKNAVSSPHII